MNAKILESGKKLFFLDRKPYKCRSVPPPPRVMKTASLNNVSFCLLQDQQGTDDNDYLQAVTDNETDDEGYVDHYVQIVP